MITADNTLLRNFEATDDQGGKFTMVFDKVDSNWTDMFALNNLGDNIAQLQLTKLPNEDIKNVIVIIFSAPP